MNKLTEMEAFTTVVDQGGFTGAAKHLGVSKSAISKHVSALEHRLGVRLLSRTTRRVDPTDIGLLYYERARRVLSAAIEADHLVTTAETEVEGELRIAVMDQFSASVLTPHITSFLEAYPAVSVILTPVDGYLEPQAAGVDGFVRCGTKPDGEMRSHILTELEFQLLASPAYLAEIEPVERMEDLSSCALLQSLGRDGTGTLFLRARSGEDRRVFAPGRLVARDTSLLIDAALAGLGIAFLPVNLVTDHIANGRLVQVLPDLPKQMAPVHLGATPESSHSPKMRTFVEHMVTAQN